MANTLTILANTRTVVQAELDHLVKEGLQRTVEAELAVLVEANGLSTNFYFDQRDPGGTHSSA